MKACSQLCSQLCSLSRLLLCSLLVSLMLASTASADSFVLAAGAGYKKMVNALADAYEQKNGVKVDRIYGNMARVTSQAKISGKVDLVLGAQGYFKRVGLDVVSMDQLGRGRLTIIWPKGRTFDGNKTFLSPEIKRIALPDTKNAIYGKAGLQYMQNTGLDAKVGDKLIVVSTVPQVFSYVIAKEVDLGFINLTHALNMKDKLGGYVLADQSMYKPIIISVARMRTAQNAKLADDFVAFTKTDTARSIIKAHGL